MSINKQHKKERLNKKERGYYMIFFFMCLEILPPIEAQTFDSFEALQINIYLRNMTVLEIKTKTLILFSSIWSENKTKL